MDVKYDEKVFHTVYSILDVMLNLLYNISATGIENIPQDETCLFAGNHLHIVDPYLVYRYVQNPNLRYMVDEKLYKHKLSEWLFRSLGTFSINPDKIDLNAIKTALNLLKDDKSLLIFPEGKTHRITDEVPFKPGVPRIAKMANAKLVPFGINGTYIPGSDLTINFGEPIDLSKLKKDEYDQELEKQVKVLQKKK